MTTPYNLQERLINYAVITLDMFNINHENYAQKHLANQLIRSSTSPALNYGEAQGAESKRDFLHKMRICLKELRESQVNLEIVKRSKSIVSLQGLKEVINETNELVAIFTKSIETAKGKLK